MKVPEALEAPPPSFPEALGYLWRDFFEIAAGLAVNGFAPPSITWEALDAWARLTNTRLEPSEARLLLTISNLRASILSERDPCQTQQKPPSIASATTRGIPRRR